MRPPSTHTSPRPSQNKSPSTVPGLFRPADRSLPGKDVTADTLADAYVAFVLYCNPHFQLDVNTEALRAAFKSPPRSDGKEFSTWMLFVLLRKLNAKQIKTWGQLALDLGVEAPGEGQSVQKVQQYTVRLKRWMRAMHIDAFFEYLMGNHHAYYTDIPHPDDPFPPGGRDGVQPEEDLAIRALDPSFRPKRGRRRNSEIEAEEETETVKQNGSGADGVPSSAYPVSANPNNFQPDPWAIASAVTPQTFAPWVDRKGEGSQTAIASTAPSHLRWQLHGGQQVHSPHPMSAHPTSLAGHIEASFEDEPRSAVTPAKRKRKHGPAVSSAWPSNTAAGAKPRGRPPATRNAQDGPFGTFPAAPGGDGTRASAQPKSGTPVPAMPETPLSQPFARPPPKHRHSDGPGRPGRLSLQVPAHTGGPVRLATPPAPRVLVNGETNESEGQTSTCTPSLEQVGPGATQSRPPGPHEGYEDQPGFAFETLKRALVTDLLRAQLIGRNHRLSGDEAKCLADAVLTRMSVLRHDSPGPQAEVARLTAASWLGLGNQYHIPPGVAARKRAMPPLVGGDEGIAAWAHETISVAGGGKRITVTRFARDVEGYESIVSATEEASEHVREVFDISWTASLGGCNGSFELKGLSLGPLATAEEDMHDLTVRRVFDAVKKAGNPEGDRKLVQTLREGLKTRHGLVAGGIGNDGIDWKTRAMQMEFGSQMAVGEMRKCKDALLEKILDALLY